MNGDRAVSAWTGLAAGLLVTIHFLLYPVWAGLAVGPNLLVGGLLLAALHLRAGHAGLLGFLLGLLEAGMTLDGLGSATLVLTLAGYGAARARDLLFADARFYAFVYLLAGTWVTDLALRATGSGDSSFAHAAGAAFVSALLTAAVAGAVEAVARSAALSRSG
ncbi:MAG: hypothetical protein RRA92_00180 [Gemmatimonadota bacterium]|nr:hypothetical protein [Gemmatimonadota bacterium]